MPPCGGHPESAREISDMPGFQVVPPCGGHPYRFLGSGWPMRVSSRAPVWGASPEAQAQGVAQRVSSRAPVWGASFWPFRPSLAPGFQVVPPCGGHPFAAALKEAISKCFKSCPRVGGIQRRQSWCRSRLCFKSCPRVGGIQERSPRKHKKRVSSRAPVWGASGLYPLLIAQW